MKITKRQLRRIIREEKVRLLSEASDTPTSRFTGGMRAVPQDELEEAIVQIFFADGRVTSADVFDRLRMDGYTDEDVSNAIDAAGGAPWTE